MLQCCQQNVLNIRKIVRIYSFVGVGVSVCMGVCVCEFRKTFYSFTVNL